MNLRLVMMGSGRFALPTFHGLSASGHDVVGLFTQPDRTGRGHHRHRNPMKESAVAEAIPVFQPENINTPHSVATLRSLQADLCVVAAYGQILSAEVITTPRLGAINLHASLLPRYRGASPVHYAILNGERETGVTIFQIEPKLDAGPILGVERTGIGTKETTGELEDRLAHLAVPLTLRVVDEIAQGTTRPRPQKSDAVTKAPSLRKAAGLIDWSKPTDSILNHIRAMQPWPNPFSFLDQAENELLRTLILDVEPVADDGDECEPGMVVCGESGRLLVKTGDAVLEILQLRPEGKRTMTAAEFLRGHPLKPGDRFVSNRPTRDTTSETAR